MCLYIYLFTLSSAAGSEVGAGGGGCGGLGFGAVQPNPLCFKFHFYEKLWRNLINLGYNIYIKYSHPLLFT